MLAKCKLKSIEKIISQTLIDLEISHEELRTIINEENYKRLKEDIRMMKSKNNKNTRKSNGAGQN